MNKSLHVYYSGSVQGVGFRFTAEHIARSLGINGWVKNLRDGRVEVLCEGREPLLKEFLDKIDSAFCGYIMDIDVRWSESASEFKEFSIRF